MVRAILTGLAAVIIAFVAYVAMLPNTFAIERTATMSASPDIVFAHVNSLRKWQEWSPWAKLDPDAKIAFEGPESGVGAIQKWSGNQNVGKGGMAIIESVPDKRVKYRLDFAEPHESTATVEIAIAPDDDGSRVTWSMISQQTFFQKAVCLVMNLREEMLETFDQGLENLAQVTEAAAKARAAEEAAKAEAEAEAKANEAAVEEQPSEQPAETETPETP